MRMLVVEDDRRMREGLAFAFQKEGYEVEEAGSVRELKRILARKADFDILILDCNLPDGDGFDVCRELKRDYGMPTILLTARDMEEEIIGGFQAGADDYVTKPFSLAILRLRVEAVKKRRDEESVLCSCDLRLHLNGRRVFRGETECKLGRTEYELLAYFLKNRNRLLSREQIWEAVWGAKERYVDDGAVSMTVSRLRQKLGPTGEYLKTLHGMGYMWKDE